MKKISTMQATSAVLLFSLLLAACQPVAEEVEVEATSEITSEQLSFYEPVLWPTADVMKGKDDYYREKMPEGITEDFKSYLDYLEQLNLFYKVGTFNIGDYAGQTLVIGEISCDGPCPPSYFRYAVDLDKDEWTLLAPYSDTGYEDWVHVPVDAVDQEIVIEALDAPETLDLYENDEVLLVDEWYDVEYSEDGKPDSYFKETEVSHPGFVRFYEGGGCLYGLQPDGMLVRYMVSPKIFEQSGKDLVGASISKELTFAANSGKEVSQTYSIFSSGCGFIAACIGGYAPTAAEEAQVQGIGTLGGREVYSLKEIGEEPAFSEERSLLQDLYTGYNNYLTRLEYAEESSPENEPMSIQEFIDAGNLMFLKMDSGAYVLVRNVEYEPAVECGKPVIYLYPEKETVVNVQVGIDEFTKTIPAYGNKGWTVLAKTNGTLKNLADGKFYPYLFWEGLSNKSIPLDEGWTLAKDESAAVLPGVLKDMGLNEKETADFMDFWLPRLMKVNEPFIEFTFVGKELFNQVAPLTITPKPDQVIRIFMYFKGVNQAGKSVPDYHAEPRFGFTVVEWGGTLR